MLDIFLTVYQSTLSQVRTPPLGLLVALSDLRGEGGWAVKMMNAHWLSTVRASATSSLNFLTEGVATHNAVTTSASIRRAVRKGTRFVCGGMVQGPSRCLPPCL